MTDAEALYVHPDRNIAIELVRATEAAAIRAYPWIGRGDKLAADAAAVDAMRAFFGTVDCDGGVVIGEGEKDKAPMLFNGEGVGNGRGPACDIAVDPIDGTSLTAAGRQNALSVIAVSDRGAMLDASSVFYMVKIFGRSLWQRGSLWLKCGLRCLIARVMSSSSRIFARRVRALGSLVMGMLPGALMLLGMNRALICAWVLAGARRVLRPRVRSRLSVVSCRVSWLPGMMRSARGAKRLAWIATAYTSSMILCVVTTRSLSRRVSPTGNS